MPWIMEFWVLGGNCRLLGGLECACRCEVGGAGDGGCPLLPALGTSCRYLGQVKSLLSSGLPHLPVFQRMYVFVTA